MLVNRMHPPAISLHKITSITNILTDIESSKLLWNSVCFFSETCLQIGLSTPNAFSHNYTFCDYPQQIDANRHLKMSNPEKRDFTILNQLRVQRNVRIQQF